MTIAVLIKEIHGHIQEIDLDIDPKKNEIFKILSGSPTFIGQWPEIEVVIIKSQQNIVVNENHLPIPFHEEVTHGPILLVRMDENSDPRDFTLNEYLSFVSRHKCITA